MWSGINFGSPLSIAWIDMSESIHGSYDRHERDRVNHEIVWTDMREIESIVQVIDMSKDSKMNPGYNSMDLDLGSYEIVDPC